MPGIVFIVTPLLLLICCLFWIFWQSNITKAALITLSLVALFTGGCSLLFTVWGFNLSGYQQVVLIFSLPPLALALLLGWRAWRVYKRPTGEQLINTDISPENQDGDADP
jgi:hypothetical protein